MEEQQDQLASLHRHARQAQASPVQAAPGDGDRDRPASRNNRPTSGDHAPPAVGPHSAAPLPRSANASPPHAPPPARAPHVRRGGRRGARAARAPGGRRGALGQRGGAAGGGERHALPGGRRPGLCVARARSCPRSCPRSWSRCCPRLHPRRAPPLGAAAASARGGGPPAVRPRRARAQRRGLECSRLLARPRGGGVPWHRRRRPASGMGPTAPAPHCRSVTLATAPAEAADTLAPGCMSRRRCATRPRTASKCLCRNVPSLAPPGLAPPRPRAPTSRRSHARRRSAVVCGAGARAQHPLSRDSCLPAVLLLSACLDNYEGLPCRLAFRLFS